MKILVAEDEAVSRRLLQTTLTKWGYEVLAVANGQEAWEILKNPDSPRLAILDWMMPKMDGVQVCAQVREQLQGPYTYLILLTAKDTKTDLISGLSSGADDYLSKPFDNEELRLRVRAGHRIVSLQEQLLETQKKLAEQASHDSLTLLYNHGAILQILERELIRVGREKGSLALIMADLDHFKRINDTYGHLAGDAVLREVSKRFMSTLRPYDCVGRYGGEEFMVVLPGCDSKAAFSQAQRLLTKLSREKMRIPEGMLEVTGSFGVVANDLVGIYDAQAYLQAADAALYRAKAGGRNCVELAYSIPGTQPLSSKFNNSTQDTFH